MRSERQFATPILRLRYWTDRPYDDPAAPGRWQLLRPAEGYGGGWVVKEDNVPAERAIALAELMGVKEAALEAMRRDALALRASAARRLVDSRQARRKDEECAVEERRSAERALRTWRELAA